MTKITVIDGDITQVKADAILTTINSNGMWIGAIDRAILKVAGTMFHDQATSMGQGDMGPLTSGDALYTTAFVSHEGAFKDVIFVVDDLDYPIVQVVLAGLELAADNGLRSVAVPTIRTGMTEGLRETREEALQELMEAVVFFAGANTLDEITVVAYRNEADVQLLTQTLHAKV